MDWTDSDEQLYRALTLEQHLSAGGKISAQHVYGSSYPCTIYKIVLSKKEGVRNYWKMPGRWYADPLNPWTLILLLFLIPANIVYFCFQVLRSLVSARNSWSLPAQGIARLEPNQISFGPKHFGLSGPIAYARITSIGHYANGLRIDHVGTKLLLQAEAAPSLFVALRHFAPNARVTSGLMVPGVFVDRCSASGRHLNISQMMKTPPSAWASQPKAYKPPIPKQKIVGAMVIVLVACAVIIPFPVQWITGQSGSGDAVSTDSPLPPGVEGVFWESAIPDTEFAAQSMRVDIRSANTFWGLEWNWNGPKDFVDFGLATNGKPSVGPTGDIVLLGVGGSNTYRKGKCRAWADGRIGMQCNILYPINTRHLYRLLIASAGASASVSWWTIEIRDDTANRLTHVAEIGLPPSATPMIIRDVAADLTIKRPLCSTVPRSDVKFGQLDGTNAPNVAMTPFNLSEIQRSGCAGDDPSIARSGTTLDLKLG